MDPADTQREEDWMDQNESNPGMVERQLDETPMEGQTGSNRGMEREGLQGGGSVEREGMQDGSVEREGMQGGEMDRDAMQDGGGMDRDSLTGRDSEQLGAENMNANDTEMRMSALEGGHGYDRPTDMTVTRDTMEGSSRTTDQGTDRADDNMTRSPDQPRGTTTARDW
jgi:hypothetical protein